MPILEFLTKLIPNTTRITQKGLLASWILKEQSTIISTSCRKGRNAYVAVSGIGSKLLSPLTASSLYRKVVVPSVLYDSKKSLKIPKG